MLYVFVRAVAAPCVVPAADTDASLLSIEPPPTVKVDVAVIVEPEIVPADTLSPD
jgi:hypothetical protein